MAKLAQTGDTIVEVLIAIAIISLVLVGAYVSTNRNIARTQDAQERSQAVKLAETQLEFVRDQGSTANGMCLSTKTNATAQSFNTPGGQPGADPCVVDGSDVQASAATEPAYKLGINKDLSTGTYTISVSWDAISGSGRDNVTMYYAQP